MSPFSSSFFRATLHATIETKHKVQTENQSQQAEEQQGDGQQSKQGRKGVRERQDRTVQWTEYNRSNKLDCSEKRPECLKQPADNVIITQRNTPTTNF
ncbi:hypothetical protein RvY_18435 [Ramazzottius varieornatus]|uniref:Uncharacterized protein n=1 Tax=Ramazzottius varieornatus TaxID=947166 RepID=A0A1D1W5R4_RAMVA|nr:hypothetical protein RvY_18435 [Ramazzottius varieornatus]